MLSTFTCYANHHITINNEKKMSMQKFKLFRKRHSKVIEMIYFGNI